jgi:hypothetical protein
MRKIRVDADQAAVSPAARRVARGTARRTVGEKQPDQRLKINASSRVLPTYHNSLAGIIKQAHPVNGYLDIVPPAVFGTPD